MDMEAQKLNVPAIFNLIDRFNKMDQLTLAGVEDESPLVVYDELEPASVGAELREFTRIERGQPAKVVAIDSSAIPIAYADRKWYLVFSAGVVLRGGDKHAPPYVFRVGPHIAEVGRREGDDGQRAARRLREYVEGSITLELLRGGVLEGRTLILIDGSLRGLSAAECRAAKEEGVVLVGISKATQVVPSSMESLPNGPGYSLISDEGCYVVVAARLEEYGVPLRIDATDLGGLPSLLSSDVIVRGYPDSLRIAHYSSIISTSEEEAALASLAMHGAALSRPLERRRVLLGALKIRG